MNNPDELATLREEAFTFVELIAALASWASSGMLPSMDVRKAFDQVGNFMQAFHVQPYALRDAVTAMGTRRGLTYVKSLASDLTTLAKTAQQTTQLTPELLKLLARLPKAVSGDAKALAALQKGLAGKSVVVTEQAAQMARYKDQKTDFARLKEIIAYATDDSPRPLWEVELKKIASEHGKAVVDEYRALVSKLNKSGQEAVAKYVAASGKKTVNVEELRQGVAKYGVYWLKIPTNFVGRVDARNTLYTVNGRALGVQPTGIATMNTDWHPDSDDTYVFSVFSENTGKQNLYYTKDYQNRARTKKFGIVDKMIDLLPAAKKRWRSNMGFASREQLLNVALELLYTVACRPGAGDGSTSFKGAAKLTGEEVTTYGMMVWRKKHCKIIPTRFEAETRQLVRGYIDIQYLGKAAQTQHHMIKPATDPMKIVHRALTDLILKCRDDEDHVWRFGGKPISHTDLVSHMREIFGDDEVSPHKFRHARGTALALRLREKTWPFAGKQLGLDYSKAEVVSYFQKTMLEVGALLGHFNGGEVTWRTAVINYVDPEVAIDFLYDAGVNPQVELAGVIAEKTMTDILDAKRTDDSENDDQLDG